MKTRSILIISLLSLALSISSRVDAFIYREYTLEEVAQACSGVMFGKVASINRERMRFTVAQVQNIKGEGQFKQVRISLAAGRGASAKKLTAALRVDAPIVIFYVPIGQERIEALGYVSGTWIRLFAVHARSGNFRWYFTHIEEYMSRTFDGDTLKLQSLIRNIRLEKRHDPVNIEVFIRHRYTLEEVVNVCSNVLSGKTASIDGKGTRIVVDGIESIKGREQFKQMKINLATGQADSAKQLIGSFRVDTPVVIFYVSMSGKRAEALGYVSGIWIRLFAIHDKSGNLEWYLAYTEKYMNHIFDGDALKLRSLVRNIVVEKKTAHAAPRSSENQGERK